MSGSWHAREGLRSYVMSFRCYTRKFLTIRHRPRCGVLFAELPLAPSQTTSVCMRRLQWTTNSVEKHAPCGNRLVHVCRSLSPRGEGRHDGQSDALEDKKKDRRETHVSWDKQLPGRPCPPVCIPVLSFLVNFFFVFWTPQQQWRVWVETVLGDETSRCTFGMRIFQYFKFFETEVSLKEQDRHLSARTLCQKGSCETVLVY